MSTLSSPSYISQAIVEPAIFILPENLFTQSIMSRINCLFSYLVVDIWQSTSEASVKNFSCSNFCIYLKSSSVFVILKLSCFTITTPDTYINKSLSFRRHSVLPVKNRLFSSESYLSDISDILSLFPQVSKHLSISNKVSHDFIDIQYLVQFVSAVEKTFKTANKHCLGNHIKFE